MQIQGAGADIWYGADGFHFACLPMDGDCQVVARIVGIEATDPWAKAGVMMRADLTQGSPHAMAALAAQYGATFIRRARPGGWSYDDAWQSMRRIRLGGRTVFQQRGSTFRSTTADSVVGFSAPVWLRLVRQGNLFRAYTSPDGTTWTWLGTDTVPMPSQVYVGVAVTSHDAAKLCTATMDNLSIGAATVPPPGSPSTGTGDGLTATYSDLTGSTVSRVHSSVNFDWGVSAPVSGIAQTNFAVTWEGQLEPQFSEPYAIHLVSDDRARLWLDGHVIDEWDGRARGADVFGAGGPPA